MENIKCLSDIKPGDIFKISQNGKNFMKTTHHERLGFTSVVEISNGTLITLNDRINVFLQDFKLVNNV